MTPGFDPGTVTARAHYSDPLVDDMRAHIRQLEEELTTLRATLGMVRRTLQAVVENTATADGSVL